MREAYIQKPRASPATEKNKNEGMVSHPLGASLFNRRDWNFADSSDEFLSFLFLGLKENFIQKVSISIMLN